MSQYIRTRAGVPTLRDFASGEGTPFVLDVLTGIPYYLHKNIVFPAHVPLEPVVSTAGSIGMRMTSDKTIVLGSGWTRMTNYLKAIALPSLGFSYDLVAGTITFNYNAPFVLIIQGELTFSEEQNGTNFSVRLYDVTAGVAFSNAMRIPVGRNQSGAVIAITALFDAPELGHAYALELGGGSTYTNEILNSLQFSVLSTASIANQFAPPSGQGFSSGFSGGFH